MQFTDTWAKSLKTRLRAITLLLFLSSTVLIATNVVLLSGMRGNAAKQKLFGQGTSYAYELLFLGHKFAAETGADRERTAARISEIARANSARYEVLLRGDAAQGIRRV